MENLTHYIIIFLFLLQADKNLSNIGILRSQHKILAAPSVLCGLATPASPEDFWEMQNLSLRLTASKSVNDTPRWLTSKLKFEKH